jgi:hypothetical protein
MVKSSCRSVPNPGGGSSSDLDVAVWSTGWSGGGVPEQAAACEAIIRPKTMDNVFFLVMWA